MATLIQTYNIARDTSDANNIDFRNKCAAQIALIGAAIRLEASSTAYHAQRLAWAQQVEQSPENMRDRMIWSIVVDPGIVVPITGVSDATINAIISALVNRFAGVPNA